LAQQQVKILQKQHQITQIALLISFLSLGLGGIFAVYRTQQQRKIKKMESHFEETAQQLQSFNYSVSHDLRHPLINAQHALNKLQQLTPNTAQAEQIKKATNANKQMKELAW
jgi:light-regulated signal transduction histidine kinase (bacteriophytochrome)